MLPLVLANGQGPVKSSNVGLFTLFNPRKPPKIYHSATVYTII